MASVRSSAVAAACCILLAVLVQAQARTLSNAPVLTAACDAKASLVPLPKESCGSNQETWVTRMAGCKNVLPNTTGILAPMPGGRRIVGLRMCMSSCLQCLGISTEQPHKVSCQSQ